MLISTSNKESEKEIVVIRERERERDKDLIHMDMQTSSCKHGRRASGHASCSYK